MRDRLWTREDVPSFANCLNALKNGFVTKVFSQVLRNTIIPALAVNHPQQGWKRSLTELSERLVIASRCRLKQVRVVLQTRWFGHFSRKILASPEVTQEPSSVYTRSLPAR